MADLVYLYAYVPADDGTLRDELASLRGIAERPVELIPCGPALAVIARVPAGDYAADRIESRLSDMHWLGDQGLAHERVVAALVDRTTVLPMRLFTLFSSEEALRDECAQRVDWLRDSLDRLAGMRQWDLKVSYDSERLLATIGEASDEVAAIDAEIEQAAPGRRYLLERRREDVARSAARAAIGELGEEVLAALTPAAVDVRRIPPPANAEPGELPVILAAALLVARDREDALRERLVSESERLAPRGVSIACSGPWAAYRFATA